MSVWSPLGRFDVNAPIVDKILDAARTLTHLLPSVPKGDIGRAYIHWSAAPFSECFSDYHVEARYANNAWGLVATHDPRDNAITTFNADHYAHATYARNEGSVAIAVTGMDGPKTTPYNFGPDPLSLAGLEWLCAGAAALCKQYEIDVAGTSDPGYQGSFWGERNVLTHAEAAHLPGDPPLYEPYGIMDKPSDGVIRWDLLSFQALPAGMQPTYEMAVQCGDALRERIHKIKERL